MVVFAVQNAIKDPPFTKLDLLSCRNLLIYLEPELQNRLILIFHYALKPNGVLFLSSSESIGNHTELFSALNRKWKFYRRPIMRLPRAAMANVLSWTAETAANVIRGRHYQAYGNQLCRTHPSCAGAILCARLGDHRPQGRDSLHTW